MSSTTYRIVRCDRCGFDETVDGANPPSAWGRIVARQEEGGLQIGLADPGHHDLCPGCASGLAVWYAAPRAPVQQPLVEPAAPKPRTWTLEDKRHAIACAAEILKAQVAASMDAVRDQPTAMLNGDVVQGALDGIDERAEALVVSVLDRLGLRPGRG